MVSIRERVMLATNVS